MPVHQLAEEKQVKLWFEDTTAFERLEHNNTFPSDRDLGVEKNNYNKDWNDLESGKIVILKEMPL